MKPLNTLTLSLFLLLFLTTSAQQKAVQYMNNMGAPSMEIRKNMWKYTSTVAHSKNARKAEKKRQALLQSISDAKKTIRRMDDFEGNTTYRDSVLSFFKIYYHVLNEDYAKIIDMEEVAEQSFDAMEAYLLGQELANEKLNHAGDVLSAEETAFANEHGITINETDDQLAKKQAKANEAFNYYNRVYLLFFKSYKQEFYLIEALGKSDISAVEQNKNSMLKFTEEDLGKLKEMESHNGDPTLITTCKEVLTFFQDEAENKIPNHLDYFLKQENFEKVQANFESIKQSKRTQADVDTFNNAVNEMNAAGEEYNRVNAELDKKRSLVLDNWNKSVTKFLNKHTPGR